MEDKYRNRVNNYSTWSRNGLLVRSPIEARMPVIQSAVTQVTPGPSDADATIVSNDDVTVVHTVVRPHSIGALILKDDYIGFYYPRRWHGDLKVNGVLATPGAIHLPVEDAFYVHGKQRDIVGCILPRTRFIETIAALRGVDPGQVTLPGHALELPASASRHVRKGLESIIAKGLSCDNDSTSRCSSFDLTNAVFELMADMYLYVRPEVMKKSGRVRNPARIVRGAEERFAEAMEEPVSLADLCAATGVSKSVLYLAFQSWCGEPPMAYFHKRRLSKARSQLLTSERRRGAVKQAALNAGLTELGRFSREYRQLFGEQPSVTLSKSI